MIRVGAMNESYGAFARISSHELQMVGIINLHGGLANGNRSCCCKVDLFESDMPWVQRKDLSHLLNVFVSLSLMK